MRAFTFFTFHTVACLCFAGTISAQEQEVEDDTSNTTPGVTETTTTVRETTTTVREEVTQEVKVEKAEPKRAAIFIKNRAGKNFDDKAGAFEDLVIGEVTTLGLAVVSPEDTVNAVSKFLGKEPGEEIPGSKLDEILAVNTSAIRLAQNMDVDYLIIASMTTFGSETKHIKRPDLDIDRKVTTYRLRSTYKILDIAKGSSLSAGNLVSEKRLQAGGGSTESADVVNDLIADAATKIGTKFREKQVVAKLPKTTKQEGMVDFEIYCSMQDLSVPEVVKNEDGSLMLTGNRYKLQPLSVTVELDGVVIGTSPGKLHAFSGLHKIRLSREGFKDWERTINIREGQTLQIAMTLTDKGRANWLQMAKFFAELKQSERLSEAQAELVRGFAQTMRQSGVRINRTSDVKVDTTEAPTVEQTNVDQQNVAKSVWP